MTWVRIFKNITLVALLAVSLSSCTSAKIDVSNVTAIVDLRSPERFEESHISGAINIFYASGSFYSDAANLSRTGKYYLYGEDESEAYEGTQRFISLGMKDVTNLGSFEDAQSILPLGVTK